MLRRWWRDTVDSTEWVETRRTLRETRAATLAQVPEGMFVRLVGRCTRLPDTPQLVAPLSERRCVAYWLTIEGLEGSHVERGAVPFVLEANREPAIVDPSGARFSLSRTREARTRPFPQPTPKQRELLDIVVGRGVVPDAITYTEATISDGDELVIGGFVVREIDRSRDRREAGPYREVATRMRIMGNTTHPLLIANDRGLVE